MDVLLLTTHLQPSKTAQDATPPNCTASSVQRPHKPCARHYIEVHCEPYHCAHHQCAHQQCAHHQCAHQQQAHQAWLQVLLIFAATQPCHDEHRKGMPTYIHIVLDCFALHSIALCCFVFVLYCVPLNCIALHSIVFCCIGLAPGEDE